MCRSLIVPLLFLLTLLLGLTKSVWAEERRPALVTSYYFNTETIPVSADYVARIEQKCALHEYCRQLYRTGEYISSVTFGRSARLHLSGESTRLPRLISPLPLSGPVPQNVSSDLVLEYVGNLEDMLALSRLLIAQLALNPQRCSPNKYWLWNDQTKRGECQCFMDRDCGDEATRLAQIEVHPILLVITIVLVLVVALFIIVRIIYTPFGPIGRRTDHNRHDTPSRS